MQNMYAIYVCSVCLVFFFRSQLIKFTKTVDIEQLDKRDLTYRAVWCVSVGFHQCLTHFTDTEIVTYIDVASDYRM